MGKANTREREAYLQMALSHHPRRPIVRNATMAFLVGGTICTIGQIILDYLTSKMPVTQAFAMTSSVMIFLGAFLTGLGVYDRLGEVAGMGAALPITGFANSIVSPAMEYKREGFVLGVSARMFQIAGPVIVYGTLTAAIVSLLKLVIF